MPNPIGVSASIENIAQTNNGQVTLNWPANPAQDNVVAYEVQWRDTATTNYKTERSANTTLTIHNLFPGKTYGFAIRALNSIGVFSAWSAERAVTIPQDNTAPAAPTGLSAYKSVRGALLFWNGNTEPDLAGYQLEWGVPLASQLASGVAITSIPLAAPLKTAIAAASTVTVDSENFTVAAAGAAAGATSIPVNSQAPAVTHNANAPVWCGQLIFGAASLATSATFIAPSGTATGTTLNFRLRAVDWSGNASAWATANAAATTDGVVIDELMVGNLKVAMTLTAGSIQTAAGGARTYMNSSGFFASDGGATDWGAGAGTVFKADTAGNVFLKGTIASSVVQSAVYLGTGTPPTYATPSTGFAIDPVNGFRWWNAGTLQAQWAANGGLTIYSGASIYGATIASEQTYGTASALADNFVLAASGLKFYKKGGTSPQLWLNPSTGDVASGYFVQTIGGSQVQSSGKIGWIDQNQSWMSYFDITGIASGEQTVELAGPKLFQTPALSVGLGTLVHQNNIPVHIATANPNGVANVSFTSIPNYFQHLMIVGAARSDAAAQSTDVYLRVNGSAGTAYAWNQVFGSNNAAGGSFGSGTSTPLVARIPAATANAGYGSAFVIFIPFYTMTQASKSWIAISGDSETAAASTTYAILRNGIYAGDSLAITQLDLGLMAGNYVNGFSKISLYGLGTGGN